MTICAEFDPDCYACQLRAKGLQVSPSATPGRVANRDQPRRPMAHDSFRAGVTGEHRRDGSFMPYLHKDGTLIRQGTMTNDRRRLEAIRHDQLHRTHQQRNG